MDGLFARLLTELVCNRVVVIYHILAAITDIKIMRSPNNNLIILIFSDESISRIGGRVNKSHRNEILYGVFTEMDKLENMNKIVRDLALNCFLTKFFKKTVS